MRTFKTITILLLSFCIGFSSCEDDDIETPKDTITPIVNPPSITTPESYDFMRNGQSSVSYSGQVDRLNQLAEIKDKLKEGDNGNLINGQMLIDMFANVGDNGNGNFSFSSSKQLKNKTFDLEISYFEDLFNEAAMASTNPITAFNGASGLVTRTNGKTVLVDKTGKEFTQLIEKGIMGATFYNQIVNNYLTNDRIGDQVNNTDLEEGKNYTKMEHHFDEAFGYFGAPTDFKTNYSGNEVVRYWANYSETVDDNIQMNDRLMNAFKRARAAIAEKKYQVKDEEVAKLYTEFEVLIAATAIHYANEAKSATTDGDRLHVLSECFAFTRAFRYSNTNNRKLSQSEVDALLGYIGDNFWITTESNLNLLIDKLATTYNLKTVKDQL